MNRIRFISAGAALAAALCVGGALAQPATAPEPTTAVPPTVRGYMTPETAPDISRIIAPPPKAGDERDRRDRAIFLATRALEGTPRWDLAAADDVIANGALMAKFSCAVGVVLTPQTAPKLARIIGLTAIDAGISSQNAKVVFQRPRPFLRDEGKICVAHRDRLALTFDYPSGHTTAGWTSGLILAELAPDLAVPILSRARVFGESRAICGMHSASAVEAARDAAAAVVAAEHANAAFRSDLEAARAEIAALRTAGPTPDAAACAAENALVNAPAYPL